MGEAGEAFALFLAVFAVKLAALFKRIFEESKIMGAEGVEPSRLAA
jgi:hypothetical protein